MPLLALLVSLGASAGSVWLSLGMGLQACPLCLYQRSFAFAAFGVLSLGWSTGLARSAPLCLLVLPLAAAGVGVAGFHAYLEATGFLECPAGVGGLGSGPQQSLAALTLLLGICLVDAVSRIARGQGNTGSLVAALLLGALFAGACIKTAPPAKIPTAPYTDPLLGCRPAYRN
jgi:disulfide bond formation protein DsbB